MKRETEDAFHELYNAYYGDVYRFVYQSLGHKEDVEDLVQEIFLQAYRNFHTFRGECEYKTWMFAIAHNHVNSMWRKFFRRKRISEQYESDIVAEVAASQADSDGEWERLMLTQQLTEELGRLPDHYREVIVLRYLHDFNVTDTGIVIGMTDAKVRMLTHRAILKLRENWDRGGELTCKIDSNCLNP